MESDIECSSPERQCALNSSHWQSVQVSWVNPGLQVLCQPDEQSNRPQAHILKHNHSSFINIWLQWGSHSQRMSAMMMKIIFRPSCWKLNRVFASLMRTKCHQDYKANSVDFELQSAVSGWLRALFPSLVNLKKEWSSQLDVNGQIKERNGGPDAWCLVFNGWKPRPTCLWRFSTVSLFDSPVRSCAFVDLLTFGLMTLDQKLLHVCIYMYNNDPSVIPWKVISCCQENLA